MRAFIFAVLVGALLCGCAADPVSALKRPLKGAAIADFPAQDLVLDTNAVFLWKKGVTPGQVSAMGKLGDAFGMNKRKLAALGQALAQFPSEEVLEKAGEKEKLAQRRGIEAQIADTRNTLGELKAQVATQCDDFASPAAISFRFARSGPSAEIKGWEISPGVIKDLSTDSRTIVNLTYASRGGEFRFAVPIDGAIYQFQIARTSYERHEKGIVTFYGEIAKKLADGSVRYGAAKLVGALPK